MLSSANIDYDLKCRISATLNNLSDSYNVDVKKVLSNNVELVWEDGFESYSIGSFPSGWSADANARSNSANNKVDNTVSYEGNNSLKLYGALGSCWGALAYKPISIESPYIISLDVMNGSENLTGCHTQRAYIGLRKGLSWTNPSRKFLDFRTNGTICINDTLIIGKYNTNEWINLKIKYEIINESEVLVTYWINEYLSGEYNFTLIDSELELTNLDLTVQEGSAWFDNIRIYKINDCETIAPIGDTIQIVEKGLTVSSLSVDGTDIKWYDSLNDGNLLDSSTFIVDESTYYASQTIDGCESSERLKVFASFTFDPKISVGSKVAELYDTVSISILSEDLRPKDSIISYQFELEFDSSYLSYVDATIINTIAENGTLVINSNNTEKLIVRYATTQSILGSGSILKLRFVTLNTGRTKLELSNFLYNAIAINNVDSQKIIIVKYGDIDNNNKIQAYDAALALQYSIGMDPLPKIDALPWDTCRILSADVDGIEGISSYDASLILQYSAELIDSFPVQNQYKSSIINDLGINILVNNNHIEFYSTGNIFGLNISIDRLASVQLGEPTFFDNNMLTAINITENGYSIGIAAAYALTTGTKIMEIPYSTDFENSTNIDMVVNAENIKESVLLLPTSAYFKNADPINIFPNPAKDIIFFTGLKEHTKLTINDLNGKIIFESQNPTLSSINISDLNKGLYFIHIQNSHYKIVRKLIIN